MLAAPINVQASNIANTDQKHNYNGLYFQDDFKVTSKIDGQSGSALGVFRPAHRALRSAIELPPIWIGQPFGIPDYQAAL